MPKVLIAEDDKFISSAYRVKLSKAGYDLKLVQDGKEAIKALEDFSPDLIILDLIMPNMDGFAVLKEIKNSEELKDIPVLVSSNLGQKEDVERAEKLGASDYIVKSDLSMDTVVEKVKKLIGA
jgi:CheY-like chemotaxis protein